MQPQPFPNQKITETGANLGGGVHVFRSLLCGNTKLSNFSTSPRVISAGQ